MTIYEGTLKHKCVKQLRFPNHAFIRKIYTQNVLEMKILKLVMVPVLDTIPISILFPSVSDLLYQYCLMI